MLLKWAGGKSWLTRNHPYIFHNEESLFSRSLTHPSIEYKKYIDPFLGGGAVFKHLQPNESLISDVNKELIAFYQCLKSTPEKLFNEVANHFKFHCEDYYYETRDTVQKKNILIAARFLYLNYTCFNGIYRVNSSNKFNVPIGDNDKFHYSLEDFKKHSKALKNAKIKNQDFKDTIYESEAGDLLYIDPPYVTQSNNSTFDMYSSKIFSWQDQIELSVLLEDKRKEGVHIIISNINDIEIINLYPIRNGWKHTMLDRANSLAYRPKGKKYKEIVISNI